MTFPTRRLAPGQRCQVWTCDAETGEIAMLYETRDTLFEAPNWTPRGDALILNGDGGLWRMPLAGPKPRRIAITGVPNLNNDHVLDPDGEHVFVSANDDWQLYRASLSGGPAVRVSGKSGPEGLMHFLHGVSPDGRELAFVGVTATVSDGGIAFHSAEICAFGVDGLGFRQLTTAGAPADGPEYGPDGDWIYFNTEAFSGHAQIARMRRDGTGAERLTHSPTVDWFPHLSPDGSRAVYLAYPPRTRGHPADLAVEIMLVEGGDWGAARRVVKLFGGQGTINVNSWSPDNRHFAYVAYPLD